MSDKKKLFLFNTLSSKKEEFIPIDKNSIKLYVCGPTVYNKAHIGNARSIVVYDLLFRILRLYFGSEKVFYIRNITDIDDKIIDSAILEKKTVKEIATKYLDFFHKDCEFLGCLKPNLEPKATDYISSMAFIIEELLKKNAAYKAKNGDIYFDVTNFKEYGLLSKRKFEEQVNNSRISENINKKNQYDFVLWKSAKNFDQSREVGLEAIYDGGEILGYGRPGWHIECSSMIYKNFGENFDIHGGGSDLKFPHHENEIAQSCCAFENSKFANFWIHNGFLMVNGEKMSKSLGNFITIEKLKDQEFCGELIRYIFFMTNYNQPLNWSENIIQNAKNNLSKLTKALYIIDDEIQNYNKDEIMKNSDFINSIEFEFLLDNMNTSAFLMHIQSLSKQVFDKNIEINKKKEISKKIFLCLEFIGINTLNLLKNKDLITKNYNEKLINSLIQARLEAKKNKDFESADRIRRDLKENMLVRIIDKSDGSTDWEPDV